MEAVIDVNTPGLVDSGKAYTLHGDLSYWTDEDVATIRERVLNINLNKPLTLTGGLVVNGFVKSQFPVKVKGQYLVGSKYASSISV